MMSLEENSFNNSKVHLILTEYNSEEKIDSVNKLLDILSKRKKIGIIVGVLLIFRKYNYNKILKDFVLKEIQNFIMENPKKLISFNGTPFTVDNCYVGMKAVYGKRRLIEKIMINSAEYLSVNLKHINLYLSEEIGKITKRPKGSIPIHRALIDEDINNMNNNNDIIYMNRKRQNEFNDNDVNIVNNNQDNNNNINNLINDDEDEISETHLLGGNIINLDDSFEDEHITKENKSQNNIGVNNNLQLNNFENNINENLFINNESTFSDKSKIELKEILSINNFGTSSPVNSYLTNNKTNISRLYNLFTFLSKASKKGKNLLENLESIISLINDDINTKEESKENFKEIFDKYENKKDDIIRIYKRLESIAYLIHGITKNDNIATNMDLDYFKTNLDNFEKGIKDIFPLFEKIIYDTHQFEFINLINKMRNLYIDLKENELEFNPFYEFVQSLINKIPEEIFKEKNIFCDSFGEKMEKKENKEEIKKSFVDALKKEGKYLEEGMNSNKQ